MGGERELVASRFPSSNPSSPQWSPLAWQSCSCQRPRPRAWPAAVMGTVQHVDSNQHACAHVEADHALPRPRYQLQLPRSHLAEGRRSVLLQRRHDVGQHTSNKCMLLNLELAAHSGRRIRNLLLGHACQPRAHLRCLSVQACQGHCGLAPKSPESHQTAIIGNTPLLQSLHAQIRRAAVQQGRCLGPRRGFWWHWPVGESPRFAPDLARAGSQARASQAQAAQVPWRRS